MANKIIADLVGTMRDTFRIGSVRLKNVSGVVTARNAADSADAAIKASAVTVDKTTLASSAAGALTFTLPANAGTSGQVLSTDGNGALSFITPAASSGGSSTATKNFTSASASGNVFTANANSVIKRVYVDVTAAFNGTPTVTVGYGASPAAYMAAADNDLLAVGRYEIAVDLSVGPSSLPVTYALVVGGATQGAADIYVEYV
jgi:hypothetical protein